MNQLTKTFEGHDVRILGKPDKPMFMLADVCKALNLSNPSKVASRVREKYKANISLGLQGGDPVFVNESGLYQVIMRADNSPITERFQDWVYEEVLPSIRKTGTYSIPNEGLSPQLQLLINMELAQKKMQQEVAAVKEDVGNMREILSLDMKDWRNGINKLLNGIAHQLGGQAYYQEVRNESYNLLQYKAGCDLNIRLNNRKSKAALRGMSKTAINKMSKLDVIAEDKKLISVYVTVIKEMAVKYKLDISRYDLPEV